MTTVTASELRSDLDDGRKITIPSVFGDRIITLAAVGVRVNGFTDLYVSGIGALTGIAIPDETPVVLHPKRGIR